MKATELRGKDIAALDKEVSDLLKAHFGLRMQRATQQLTNHTQLGNTRRDIARTKTIIAEKKAAEGKTGGKRASKSSATKTAGAAVKQGAAK